MTMRRWVDWVNVMLGLWLISSPWFPTPAAGGRPAWNSLSAGIAIVLLALFAMRKPAVSVDVIGIMFGAWLIASPWMLGFASSGSAAHAVIIGILVVGYALWALRIDISFRNDAEAGAHRRGRR